MSRRRGGDQKESMTFKIRQSNARRLREESSNMSATVDWLIKKHVDDLYDRRESLTDWMTDPTTTSEKRKEARKLAVLLLTRVTNPHGQNTVAEIGNEHIPRTRYLRFMIYGLREFIAEM